MLGVYRFDILFQKSRVFFFKIYTFRCNAINKRDILHTFIRFNVYINGIQEEPWLATCFRALINKVCWYTNVRSCVYKISKCSFLLCLYICMTYVYKTT